MDTTVHSHFECQEIYYDHSSIKNHSSENFKPHFHDITEIIFLKSSNISYLVGGKKYSLAKNMLVLSRPTDRHCICVEPGCEYERYNILYDEKKLLYNIYEKIPTDVNVINFKDNVNIINIFNKMDFYCKKLQGEDLKKMLANLIEEIFYNIVIEVNENQESKYTETNPLMYRALEYIDENLLTIESIDDICSQLFITKSHLHHLFMKHLKITPKKYITAKRLALARQEIYAGGKATEVCIKCGFSDYSAFFRAYKKHFGKCPSDMTEVSDAKSAKEHIS